jgi:hypothetical protein
MKSLASRLTLAAVVGLGWGAPRAAHAVSYASGVRNTAGAMWEFVLNEPADNVSVVRNGGNTVNLGALAAGRHVFDMTGFTTFDIKVAKSAPAVWTDLSSATNSFARFEQGSDVIVQTNPSHPLFGTIYVNNDRTAAAAGASGRTMGDGVYALTADMIGVDLPTRAALTDPTDVTAAKAPGWNVSGTGTTGDVSAWRLALDGAGNLLAADWSDVNGGIKWASPDLTTGGALLVNQNGVRPLPVNGSGQEVHGSIVSRPQVSGSIGNNLVIMAMDEDLDSDGETALTAASGNHIWRWNVGNVLSDFDQPPTLVVNSTNIQDTSDFRDNWLSLNSGVLANAIYSAQHNKWYMSQNRSNGSEAGLIVVTPDGVDGNTPTLDWSSMQFTVDNSLDGNTATGFDDIQDIFRSMGGGMTLSPDGTKLYVHRVNSSSANPVLGTTSPDPGAVLIIPLNASGIPDLQVSEGAITNLDTITTANNGSSGTRRGLALDAAGNVYTTNNVSERLQVWSPGGDWLATTSSTGTFSVAPLVVGPANNADFDNDGDVDGADFLTWQRNLGATGQPDKSTGDATGDGNVNAADLAEWQLHFAGAPAEGAAGAVPEPASVSLTLAALAGIAGWRRRR